MEKRIGKYMTTYSGIKFYPLDPRKDEILLEDIAHALSLICRFGGQCKSFYSVGQHSINVSNDLKNMGYDEQIQLFGLLHDGSEAYISDIVRPLKHEWAEYLKFEEKVQRVIYSRFGLFYDDSSFQSVVKESDDIMLMNEAIALMSNTDWITDNSFRRIDLDTSFRNPKDVEEEFIVRAKSLIKK